MRFAGWLVSHWPLADRRLRRRIAIASGRRHWAVVFGDVTALWTRHDQRGKTGFRLDLRANGPAGPRAEAAPPIDPLAQRPGESRQAWVERLGVGEEKHGG